MANVTYTSSEAFKDAIDKICKRVITVHVNGNYADTMVVSGYISDKEIDELYQRSLIDDEKTKQSWSWQ